MLEIFALSILGGIIIYWCCWACALGASAFWIFSSAPNVFPWALKVHCWQLFSPLSLIARQVLLSRSKTTVEKSLPLATYFHQKMLYRCGNYLMVNTFFSSSFAHFAKILLNELQFFMMALFHVKVYSTTFNRIKFS